MQEPTTQTFPQTSDKPAYPERQDVCDVHGPFTSKNYSANAKAMLSFTIPECWSKCPACLEQAATEKADKEARAAAREKQGKIAQLVNGCCIPPRFADRSIANYTTSRPGQVKAAAVARRFVDNWAECKKAGRSMVFTGGPGTGKTHLACAIAREIAELHMAAPLFITVSAMLRHVKSTYRKDANQTETGAISDFTDGPDLLIVDEIGVQVGSDHEKLLLFEILNERYQCLRPTILISNLNITELEAYLGQRIMDRYRECGAVIAFDWESHRGIPVL
jgi:DNA replication protein DnaC